MQAKTNPSGGRTFAQKADINRSITEVPESQASRTTNGRLGATGAETSQERPVRDTSGAGGSAKKRSPYMSAVGGGNSAERLRKGERDAYEERVDEMQNNIGKFSVFRFC